MTIARAIKEQMGGSSLIRKMFEEGERLKKFTGRIKFLTFLSATLI